MVPLGSITYTFIRYCVSPPSPLPISLSVRGFDVSLHSSSLSCEAMLPSARFTLTSLCMPDDVWDPFLLIPSSTPQHRLLRGTAMHSAGFIVTQYLPHLPVPAQLL